MEPYKRLLESTIGIVDAPSEAPAPDVSAAVHLSTAADEAFGGGFRQWSYGEWDGRLTDSPIDENALRGPDGTETEEELQPEWFAGCGTVGISAGASTPDWVVEGVARRLRSLG